MILQEYHIYLPVMARITRKDLFDILETQDGDFVDPNHMFDGIIHLYGDNMNCKDMIVKIYQESQYHQNDVFVNGVLKACIYYITLLMLKNEGCGEEEKSNVIEKLKIEWNIAMSSIEKECDILEKNK